MIQHIVKITIHKTVQPKYLIVNSRPRYWEDAEVNGKQEDNDDPVIPFRYRDSWDITIDLETGEIQNWPIGNTAYVYYKIVDDLEMYITDIDGNILAEADGHIPSMLYPTGDNPDCVNMHIDTLGKIRDFQYDFRGFEDTWKA